MCKCTECYKSAKHCTVHRSFSVKVSIHPSYRLEYEKAQPSLTSVLFRRLKQIYCLQQEQSAGAALVATELRKHTTNDTKCAELGLHSTCGGII